MASRKILLCAAFLLSVCACSKKSVEYTPVVELPELPAELRYCPEPIEIDYSHVVGGLYGPENLYKNWARDRGNLVTCRNKHGAVVVFYDTLRADLNQKLAQSKPE